MKKGSYASPMLVCLGNILALTRSNAYDPKTEMFDQAYTTKNQ